MEQVAKIADLGISRVANVGGTMTHKGTIVYQAPEVSRGERYGLEADIYSFALTMYELCDRVSCGIFLGIGLWKTIRTTLTLPPHRTFPTPSTRGAPR